jgi:hypothetical protein
MPFIGVLQPTQPARLAVDESGFPPSLCFRLRIAPVFTELRRGKSPRQVGAPGRLMTNYLAAP